MDQRQIDLVQRSFAHAERFRAHLTVTFYNELFALEPSLRSMFKGDMTVQARKLNDMLKRVVEGLGEPDATLPEIHALALRHIGYGVEAHHYGLVGTALLRTLRHELGAEFTNETRAAWVAAYEFLADEMRTAATGAAAQA
jgi:nitric oxide dioxygenase